MLVRAGYDLEFGIAELTIQQDAPIQGQSVLHGVLTPPVGGDTLRVDMVAVVEGLLAPIRQFLIVLTARHTTQKGFPLSMKTAKIK